jgi:hypothetical protein
VGGAAPGGGRGAGAGGTGGGQRQQNDNIPAEYRSQLDNLTIAKIVPQLRRFVEDGGTIITVGSSTNLANHFGLPVTDALVRTRPHNKLTPSGFALMTNAGRKSSSADATATGPGTTPSEAPTRSFGVAVSSNSISTRLLATGQHFGPYRIGAFLGGGGMGQVYEAEHLESGRRIALKVLARTLDSVERERFLREGRLAASVSHPNTVYVFETEEIQGVPVIIMELVSGGTLKDRVTTMGPLAPRTAVDVILQVIAGLDAAHRLGILHRDVKPSNCFIDASDQVKVGDFGLAITSQPAAESQLTLTGTFLGTPAFASPERILGERLDERSDIYSVGATLYYLLTGRPPFDESNIVRLAALVAQQTPRGPFRCRFTRAYS